MRRLTAFLLAGALGAAGPLSGAPARADLPLPVVVSADPVDFTPHVTDGTVWAVALVGDTVVVGGDFTGVTDSSGKTAHERKHLFAYKLTTGEILPWAPTVDRPVYALAAGAGRTVYIGGWFKTVNGAKQRGVAYLSLDDGQRVPGFKVGVNWGDVRALAADGNRLYLGGTFSTVNGVARAALARVDAGTGAVDADFDAKITAPGLQRPRVEDLALSPDGKRLVIIGAMKYAAGQPRNSVALFHTGGPTAALSTWYTNAYAPACMAGFDTYVRAVDFSPGGDHFVIVTTGRASGPAILCDSAARFNVAGAGSHLPVWVNRTGGDSLYAVAVTEAAVYIGGHQRWVNNPFGKESAGPGAVARPGVAALHPATGKALSWNPGKARGVGTRTLVATPAGLLIGSDTDKLGGEKHGRIGMFPLP
ncbi:hypothetical protein GCM10010123_24400 [Pilimelia anulata]|uniref:Uncharacterized protein n=1 Tax=Pilimelia anulata TaxID=53371 RepID=A0A8J3B8S5_9ACTN|nr:delta-60 repeat domain-containing protein [Pilimelia anulata]GGJ93651.1 hypothetical protein GCM10010123_24400 [Pilimelia anulata]